MGEELELPRIQPKGTEKIVAYKDKYTGIRTTGPESLRHFRRTYQARRCAGRSSMGTYDPKNPVIIPITRGQALPLVAKRCRCRSRTRSSST